MRFRSRAGLVVVCCLVGVCVLLYYDARRGLGDKDLKFIWDGGRYQPENTGPKDPTQWWFMRNGSRRPEQAERSSETGFRLARVWPVEDSGDRIVNQLLFVPPAAGATIKTVYVENLARWDVQLGTTSFVAANCPVDACAFTTDRRNADALLLRDEVKNIRGRKVPQTQIWILYVLENPYYSGVVKQKDSINWTASYRTDSDIVAPYEKWVYYDEAVRRKSPARNFAEGKTKKVAWFVSNCNTPNDRLQYAHKLQKYIQVDIYGRCGDLRCAKGKDSCLEMLRQEYKFYLAFENANCRDYITEKFYLNALQHDVVPIVMGAHPDDYKASAPEHSYIHVDDFANPEDLANYLKLLDSDPDLYNTYFEWQGTGEFIDTHFVCRLCAMLHDEAPPKHLDFMEWWNSPNMCRKDSWTA